MSVILGVLKERGARVGKWEIRKLSAPSRRFAKGETTVHVEERMGMGFQSCPSHERSRMETGPCSDLLGNVVCFDGRLDNVRELASLLDLDEAATSDSAMILAAFRHWGEESFSRFTGDWALSLWSEREGRLYLARDHAGTRTLYFEQRQDGILWSTYLDTFMVLDTNHQLSQEYAATYLCSLPVRDRTPYDRICGVRPGHYIVFQDQRNFQRPHWSPLIKTSIRYKEDRGYDEHFLALFEASVARRTGAGVPILAQLSGGMDSTSIVCMSDHIRRSADAGAEILDTISFFDDSESSLNERAYFTITESQRSKEGIHLNTAFSQRTFDAPCAEEGCYLWPGADSFSVLQERRLKPLVWDRDFRVVLSGIGGDEVLGGVPVDLPELADYLVSANLTGLFRQSIAWCLVDRSPLIGSLYDTARYTFDLYTHKTGQTRKIPPWLSAKLKSRVVQADDQELAIPGRLGAAPHRLDNALTWWAVMETLPHLQPQILFRPEYRYPMLDKDLVTFLFSIPREQLVRPGRRRAMMRRALHHIVPNEILERRRKAFQLRAPLNALQQAHEKLDRLWASSVLAEEGFIDVDVLRAELRRCAHGDPEWNQALFKAVAYELWLRARRPEETDTPPLMKPDPSRMSLAGS
jgi:asparagine synthase (glutamine-hydrolysing)